MKKLRNGDAFWTTRKKMIGWIVDTAQFTIELPAVRAEKLRTALALFPRHLRRTSAKKWYRLLGILRSVVDVLPGGMGLFCHLQNALLEHKGRIPLSDRVHNELDDWRRLVYSLATRKTNMMEVLPPDATTEGCHDACGKFMGVFFAATTDLRHCGGARSRRTFDSG